MTEQEWLASEDPAELLAYLSAGCPGVRHRLATDRKLRLFACACCREVWHLLTDPRSRRAVEVAERFADGEVTNGELEAVNREARFAVPNQPHYAVEDIVGPAVSIDLPRSLAEMPGRFDAWLKLATQAHLLRDIVNPFRSAVLDPSWLTPTVLSLARAAYEERVKQQCDCHGGDVFVNGGPYSSHWEACSRCQGSDELETGHLDNDRLAVLADALEDAGCDNEDILSHLRGKERCHSCFAERPEKWQCRRCRAILSRDQCATRYGILECSSCLYQGWVGLLERWRPACNVCQDTGRIPLRGPHVRGCVAVDLILGRE